MGVNPKYKQYISEFIRRQAIILGPNLATDTANRIEGLEVNDRGQIIGIVGDEVLILQALLGEFGKLSAELTSYVAHALFERFPEISEQHASDLPKVSISCPLMRSKV